ncbi:hypothetical protein Emag_003756 [Eimeria magna]
MRAHLPLGGSEQGSQRTGSSSSSSSSSSSNSDHVAVGPSGSRRLPSLRGPCLDSSNSASAAASASASASAAAAAAAPAPEAEAAVEAAAPSQLHFLRIYCRPFSRRHWDVLWDPRFFFAADWGPPPGGPLCVGAPMPEAQLPAKPSKRGSSGEGGPWWAPRGLSVFPMLQKWLGPLMFGGGLAVGIACARRLLRGPPGGPLEAPFSQFLVWLKRGELQQVCLHQVNSDHFVYFRLKGAPLSRGPTDFFAKMLPGAEALVAQLLVSAVAGHGAPAGRQQPAAAGAAAAAAAGETLHVQALPSTATLAFWDLLVIFISLSGLAILAATHLQWLQRPPWGRADGDALGGSRPRVTFADVAGGRVLKSRLQQAAKLLTNPEAYSSLGAKPPRGILLEGPTGTGFKGLFARSRKTLAARALAGEAGVPFLYGSASSFVEVYAGRGAARVRKLFAEASRLAPCVVFLDEIDAIGAHRYSGINLPDEEERLSILRLHFRGVPLHPSVSLPELSAATEGLSGACLAALCNEAALLAARRELLVVGPLEVLEALEDIRRANRCAKGRGPSAALKSGGPRAAAAAAAAAAAGAAQQQLQRRRTTGQATGTRSRGAFDSESMDASERWRQQQQQQQQQLSLAEEQLRALQDRLLQELVEDTAAEA